MPNYQTKLVKLEEVDICFSELFSADDKIFRIQKDPETQQKMSGLVKKFMSEGIAVMTSVVDMDDGNRPVAMYIGYKFPSLKGWIVGLTKVAGQYNHFNKSAEIMAPALDLLINEMENAGYYKFWMVAPEQHHNIRNTIMKKHSKKLGRYQWFDEEVIKRGSLSTTQIFNAFRGTATVDWTDLTVRLFVLDQNERVNYLRQENNADYKGTIV